MPPVVIAAGIGAVGAIGGGLLASHAQSGAAQTAADTSLAVAHENNALATNVYNQNYATLNPYAQRGNEAGGAINALLGIAGTAPAATTTPPLTSTGATGGGFVSSGGLIPSIVNQSLMTRIQAKLAAGEDVGPRMLEYYQAHSGQTSGAPQATATAPASASSTPLSAYQGAFQNYLDSTGYQFQVDQGNKQITQGYAGRGSLQSGAALKALQTYGQNTATGFFKDYLGLLGNQQGVGLAGASAIAGVGQNYVNTVGANNNAAGTAAANSALASGNAAANLYGTIGGAIGGVANAWGSSYGPHG